MTDFWAISFFVGQSELIKEHMLNIAGEFALAIDEGDFHDHLTLREWMEDRAPGGHLSMEQSIEYRCQRCKGSWPCFDFLSCSQGSFTPKTDGEVQQILTTIELSFMGNRLKAQRVQSF